MIAVVAEVAHRASRPAWDCASCLRPWPCAPAKAYLRESRPKSTTQLTLVMAGLMAEAHHDLTANGAAMPPDLGERFLNWLWSAASR